MLLRMMSGRWTAVGAALLVLSLACSSPRPANQPAAKSSDTGAAQGSLAASQVLKVRFYDDPSGFDPATLFRVETENIAFNIYSGLTTYDSQTKQIVPDLAEKWTTSSDGRTWTFNLRKGVQWQKGYGELTSADVKYSYTRIMDQATASPYRAEFNNIEAIDTPDPYTVVINLKRPDANFLHQVANYHQGQVVKKEAVDKAGDQYRWNPVGTGPFELENFTPGSQIILARHAGYFRGPATLERIILPIIKDDDTAAIALQNGEVDLAMRIMVQESLNRLEQDSRLTLNKASAGITVSLFSPQFGPFQDVRVRRAWAHAIDRAALVKATTPYTATAWQNLLNDWMDVYTSDVPQYEYNPDKAKALLAEAGYPNGFTVKHLWIAATGVSDADQLEKDYLSKVGINLEFERVDTPTVNSRRNNGDFQLSLRQLPAMNPDTILFSYLHPDNSAPRGLNSFRYDNPELTKQLESARAELDPEKRKQLYKDVLRIAMTDLPVLPYSQSVYIWPGFTWVTGVVINPLAQVNFYDVKILQH